MNYKNKPVIVGSLLSVAVVLYCYNPFALYFQNDDFVHIPLSAQGILLQHNTFRPFCDLSIMFDYWLWGKNAWGYHLTNLLLHILTCIILFFFLRLILRKYFGLHQSIILCWLPAVLFFMYAMHSEAVFWILGRSAILGTIFSLLFLHCYTKRYETTKYITGYILFFTISLLTYESAWMLPLFCLLMGIADIKKNKELLRREVKYFITIVVIFILYLFARWHYIHEITGNYESSAFLHGNIEALIRNFSLLFARSFLPAFTTNKLLLICFIAIALIIAIMFLQLEKQKRKKTMIIFISFLASLLPYCSLGIDTHGTESERFLYFPTMLLCMFLGVLINFSSLKKVVQYLLLPLLFIGHIIILLNNTNNYRNAGSISKMITTEFEKLNDKKVIYAIDLPQSQNGALILRQGLPEMTKWMADNPTIDTVIVCSQRSDLKPLQFPYNIRYSNNWKMNCNNMQTTVLNHNDVAVLRFTDSILYITR